MDELVGRAVKKRFLGFGIFSGVIRSYDPSSGYFKVEYEDGDSEEVDSEEIVSILQGMGDSQPAGQIKNGRDGRNGKKRRRGGPDRGFFQGPLADSENDPMDDGIFCDAPANGETLENASLLVEENGCVGGEEKENASSRVSEEAKVNEFQVNASSRVSEEAKVNEFQENAYSRVSEEAKVNELQENAYSGPFEETELKGKEGLEENSSSMETCRATHMEEFQGIASSEGKEETQLKGRGGCSSGTPEKDEQLSKKKRKLSGKLKVTPEMPLRRSARRASTAALQSPPNAVSSVDEPHQVNASVGENEMSSGEIPEDIKLALPPSSKNLNLDGLPILDVFSVYACLRSFSTILFLSPFELQTFVDGLKCNYANSLIDSVHFAILQALRPHLELLSDEGSQSASDCLRSLNWEFLDLVTWPVYLVEYLIIRGSQLIPGFKLTHLKLLNGEYYKQPVAVKLEILRCLCDDVIEVEAIRSELSRRMLEPEHNVDVEQSMVAESKQKDSTANDLPMSSLPPEVSDDGNSDECCLCRMDGSLICCDGCPAAFHSRCVGMARDLLPEGDWYCPECIVGKHDGLVASSKPFRGAEILGIDPHGRLYFGSCGYLLVSDSFGSDASHYYYNKSDSPGVIEVLQSSYILYSGIINAISLYLGISVDSSGSIGHDSQFNCTDLNGQSSSILLSPPGQDVVKGEVVIKREPNESPGDCGCQISPNAEGSDEMARASGIIQMHHKSGANFPMFTISSANEGLYSKRTELILQKKLNASSNWYNVQRKVGAVQMQSESGAYINYYSFARISSVSEELMRRPFDCINKDPPKPPQDLVSAQLKEITKKSMKVFWSSFHRLPVDALKESCGWCFSCRTPSDSECLFKIPDNNTLEGSKIRAVGLRSMRNRKSHIISAAQQILLIEDQMHGLLSGPWENPFYRKQWRKSVLKAADVASLKQLLLMFESNLRRVALSADWMKPVDSAITVGSASHVLTSSVCVSSRHGGGRKQAKRNIIVSKKNLSDAGFNFAAHAATSTGIYWWRGGRLSRQLFQWKMLPRSLASKGGRQAGCRKILGVLYPEDLEFAKRSKYVTWRAAVEMSKSVEQLSFLVKDLDSHIRWNDLASSQLFPTSGKESKKLLRPLKNISIRGKCIEGTIVKYLLDFGKRKVIPEIVTRHGVMLESSSKKKYWLNESLVPLHLLKAFEVKKLDKILHKLILGLLSKEGGSNKVMKPKEPGGISHLSSRQQKSEHHHCGHCNKDVLLREAVRCQFCKGFFHKKHFRVPKGAITTTYTCCECVDKRNVKVKGKNLVVHLDRSKSSQGITSKHVSKKRKAIKVKRRKKANNSKECNQLQSEGGTCKRLNVGTSWSKGKRSSSLHSYWLNGLLWARKPDDKQGIHFRERNVIMPVPHSKNSPVQPICCLCREEYNSDTIYVGCENCGDWFHGDAFSLGIKNISNLSGFKCHKCRMISTPVCPYLESGENCEYRLMKESYSRAGTVDVKDLHDDKLLRGTCDEEEFLSREDCRSSDDTKECGDEHTLDAFPDPQQTVMFEECNETRSENGLVNLGPNELIEAKYSFCNYEEESGHEIGVSSLKETIQVPDLLVSGTLGDC